MICAAAICASPLLVRAEDTGSQAKMREALRQKMATTNMQSPAPSNAGNVTKPVDSPTMSAVKPTDAEAQNKMRDALRAKMAEVAAQKQVQMATPTMSSQPVTPKTETGTTRAYRQPAPAVSLSPTVRSETSAPVGSAPAVVSSPKTGEVKPSDDAAREAALSQALNHAMETKNSTAGIIAPDNAPPMYDPNLPISADKQKELNALLMLYEADRVTPEEYHQKRAKILSAP